MDPFFKPRQEKEKENNSKELFGTIKQKELLTKNIDLYSQINSSTSKIASYFESSINKFPSLFDSNLNTFEESLTHLQKISIPNKCVCAGVINSIPGWVCITCSKYENTLYCNDCFVKSKDLHKGHEVYYSSKSQGMCDCGDPDSLYTYCHEHSGPFVEQKQIEEYIEKSFEEKLLKNLKDFFGEFFAEFSKYFLLTAKCELFMEELFDDKFNNDEPNEDLIDEKKDVEFLKENFKIVFENFILFLRSITKNNLGMVHLISSYFLKNNLESTKLEEEYKTDHHCIEIKKDDIKIYFNTSEKNIHECKCPFLRLFLVNYRNNIELLNKEEEREFMFTFVHNLPSRCAFLILYYFLYNQNLYNNNSNVDYIRTQFFLEDALELIAQKTPFIEKSTELIYKFLIMLNKKYEKKGMDKNNYSLTIATIIAMILEDIRYYSKPKSKKLMTDKTSYFTNIIDIIGLFLNIYEYKSIVPHPIMQDKFIDRYSFGIEQFLLKISGLMNTCFDWTKIDKLKNIYKYIINKIINQEKEGIKQLKENEFSYHICLYRTFGILMNAFCFNYSFINNCTILDSIIFFKKNFFESQEQVENFVEIIFKNYFKFIGFICGIKNGFFNYYDQLIMYFNHYCRTNNMYQSDASLLKYLFALSEKKLDIISYLKQSNIENVFDKFYKTFNIGEIKNNNENTNSILTQEKSVENKELKLNDILNMKGVSAEQRNLIFKRFLLNQRVNREQDKSKDEFYIILQWKILLEFLIFLIKDDSSCYYNLINAYDDIISSKTKSDLINDIKNNKFVMEDLKNILHEKLVHNIVSQGNLIDAKNLEKNIDEYLLNLFKKNNVYNEMVNELTFNKLNGETIMFYLKDENFKFLDCNYFLLPKVKSAAQKYILDFKKDIVKTYNYHLYNYSELTFEFYLKMYEQILLNKNNLELIFQIINKLKNNEKISEFEDTKTIRNLLLPIMLNYLQIFNVINTKSFIEFKIENKSTINKLYELLQNIINNNSIYNIVDKDLEDNIKEILNQMNLYQTIFDYFNGDLTKLNKYDYNTNILQNKNSSINTINSSLNQENENILNKEKKKSQKAKEKLKLLMKKKKSNFLEKIETDAEMSKTIKEQINDVEIAQNNNDETMCFYCRNPIKLNSFEEPYGKLGLYIKDLFYINSIKSTLREEFSKLDLNNKYNKIYEQVLEMTNKNKFFRITSCGHYFHNSCFAKGCKITPDGPEFQCPLCLKYQNILIPPLALFHDKYLFFKSEKLNELFKDNENIEEVNKIEEIKEEIEGLNLFNSTALEFLSSLNTCTENMKNYESFLDVIFPYYKAYLTYFENIFYADGTTFHKHQQIDNMKNYILSLRLLLNNSKDLSKFEIVKFIKEKLLILARGPEENIFLYKYNDSYMHYLNLFEKIIFSLEILFDYEEIKEIFKYILYIFLPYYLFGYYLKKLVIQKQNNVLSEEQFIQKLNMDEFNKYLKENNEKLLEHLTSLFKKFCFIKLITDYQNKNEEIINSFNQLSFNNILSIINMENLLQFLPPNDINIIDIISQLPKIFSSNEIFYNILSQSLNFDKILNSIFENIKKNNPNSIYEITPEFFIQSSPIKFNFIQLDNNIFDLIEKNTEKKCSICERLPKKAAICLICGEKLCYSILRLNAHHNELFLHTVQCTGSYCMFIKFYRMKLYYVTNRGKGLKLFPIYVNKSGIGVKDNEFSGEFNLSKEKLKLILKNYLCNDFLFKNE